MMKCSWLTFLVLLLAPVWGALLWASSANAQSSSSSSSSSYTVTELYSSNGGTFYPTAINDSGHVVGRHYPPEGAWRAGIWRDGTFTSLPLLEGTGSGYATAINNQGQVVGACEGRAADGSWLPQACLWQNGMVIPLPALPGSSHSWAKDINDSGAVVGVAWTPIYTDPYGQAVYRRDAVLWQGSQVTVLPAPPTSPGAETMAQAIDNSGRVAAAWLNTTSGWIPSRWTPNVPGGTTGTMTTLDPLGGWALDINDSGLISGYDAQAQAAVWEGTSKTGLGILPDFHYAYGMGINQADTVVGYAEAIYYGGDEYAPYYNAFYAAWVWDATSGMRNLNSLLNAPTPLAVGSLVKAMAVNDMGQILVETEYSGRYVLLTPSSLPPAPANLWAYGEVSKVTLNWSAAPGAASYSVKRSTASGGPYTTIASGVASTSYADQSVTNNATYYYVVSAANADGESVPSNEASATPGIPAPGWLGAYAGDGWVRLDWSWVSGASGYNVKRATSPGGPYTTIAAGVTDSGFTDTAVTNGTRYYYVVSAVAGSVESLNSYESTARPLGTPAPPTRLTAKVTGNKVQLKWTQSSSSDIALNKVYRSTASSSGPYVTIAEIPAGTSFVDSFAPRGSTSYYVVTALNENYQESAYSNQASAKPR